jgi:ADP-heptose:LPS heptosyltransferase
MKINLLYIFSRIKSKLVSNIKLVIKFCLYGLIDLFVLPSKKIIPKTILLIRLDAIGDYVLFRNFIKDLKEDKKFKEYKITFLGNLAWKELSIKADCKHINNFIWIDRVRFFRSAGYRLNKLREITSNGYEMVIHPVHSREFFLGDNIVKLVTSDQKIGSVGDYGNMTKIEKKKSDRYYSKLQSVDAAVMYEYDRNKEFFECLLDRKIATHHRPKITVSSNDIMKNIPDNYVVLFIGANTKIRKWNIKNYVDIAQYLYSSHIYRNHKIALCGSNLENQDAALFKGLYGNKFLNFVGKTNLNQLAAIISKSSLIITNETSAQHIAVAVDCPNIVVLYNGNHFGRFVPLGNRLEGYKSILHPEIKRNTSAYVRVSNSKGYVSTLNINHITTENVIEALSVL